MIKYIAHRPIDMSIVGGEGFSPAHVTRSYPTEDRMKAVEFVANYRSYRVAQVVAIVLNLAARWEVLEQDLPDYKIKPLVATPEDVRWAERVVEEVKRDDQE